jgi:hypothetical protein
MRQGSNKARHNQCIQTGCRLNDRTKAKVEGENEEVATTSSIRDRFGSDAQGQTDNQILCSLSSHLAGLSEHLGAKRKTKSTEITLLTKVWYGSTHPATGDLS